MGYRTGTYNEELRENMNKAFNDMRKVGFIARQDFSCCQSCAGSELAREAAKRVQAGKTVNGVVYYHHQDAEGRNEGRNFYLAYGEVDSDKIGKIRMDTKTVGERVCEILKKHNVPFEWDGTSKSRILITQKTFVSAKLTEAMSDTISEVKMAFGKPVCKLVGEDGNVFSIIGRVSQALKRANQREKAAEFVDKATHSKSYDAVLALCFDYVEVR
jgi:hypothetical protein